MHRPEQVLQLRIIHYLKAIGAVVGKTKTTGVANRFGQRYRDPYLFIGFPDLTVFHKSKIYFIEVKAGKNRQTVEQVAFEQLCAGAGVRYILARSVEDVERVIL